MPTRRRSQADRTKATRTALTDTARGLFAERGYANVPADELVRRAGVTRGALYHHYTDKQDLFREVVEQLEAEVAGAITDSVRDIPDPWAAMVTALDRFLTLCLRPDVLRIALTDAPAVLGWQAWRDIESRYGLGLITDLLRAAERDGRLSPVPVSTLAPLILSAIIEAALLIAHADDPEAARTTVRQSLLAMLSGIVVR